MNSPSTVCRARWIPRVSRGGGEILSDACGFVAAAASMGIPCAEAATARAADPGPPWLGLWLKSAAGIADPAGSPVSPALDPLSRSLLTACGELFDRPAYQILSARRTRKVSPGMACLAAPLLPLLPPALFVCLLWVVVPAFEDLYASLGAELPPVTEMFVWVSGLLRHGGTPELGLFCILGLSFLALPLSLLLSGEGGPQRPKLKVGLADTTALSGLGSALHRGRATAVLSLARVPGSGAVEVSLGEFSRGRAVAAISANVFGIAMLFWAVAVGFMVIALIIPLFVIGPRLGH